MESVRGDGSDFMFRQTVDERYREMAKMRRRLTTTSLVQLGYVIVRTAWKCLPTVVHKEPPASLVDFAILVGGILLFLFYRHAFGYGKAQHEKLWAIMACTVGNVLLLAECFLTFWIYHVMLGPNSIYPDHAAVYPPIPRALAFTAQTSFGLKSSGYEIVLAGLNVLEKGIDAVGLFGAVAGVLIMREYAMEKRELAREQEAKRSSAATKKAD